MYVAFVLSRASPSPGRSKRIRADLYYAQTLSVFLSCVLSKKYPHPSSDVIAVLAGLDYIDTIFTEFVGTLDGIIRNGKTCKGLNGKRPKEAARLTLTDTVDIRHKAIEVLLATTAGAYQTTLLTYMIQRDLFPSIMKVCYPPQGSSTKNTSSPLLVCPRYREAWPDPRTFYPHRPSRQLQQV